LPLCQVADAEEGACHTAKYTVWGILCSMALPLLAQVMRPAVGVQHGVVERAVGEVQPGGALVVEVRQRAALQLFLRGAGRVEPGVMPNGGVRSIFAVCLRQRITAWLFVHTYRSN
jgi:hypothetical protein